MKPIYALFNKNRTQDTLTAVWAGGKGSKERQTHCGDEKVAQKVGRDECSRVGKDCDDNGDDGFAHHNHEELGVAGHGPVHLAYVFSSLDINRNKDKDSR
jgi:hypothetical protein